ncbi:von Willebrand factor A-like domain superfamily [Arabidopsis thaliana x Arabidopsis arenosa]|uniref:von Willebrand factor A-like domain superfamily n=1 Tax=Arabidopsis thaliana x Arabidopsis arenosa TaxID=1240361 RepID=A0A8T1YWK2_9BRAS|nr:von Willebrand factor A-like domain superfamily [Arabidopsis thaliana x Arabidopsis arenosa]
MSPPLLGPPELRDPNSLLPKPITTSGPSNPFMDAMVSNFNNSTRVNVISSPPMGYTENNSATHLSSGNPCLDFFFHVVPSTPKDSLEQRLQGAWDHDALTTLKLICNLRGVRGTGKSDKEGFYTAALWLHGRHPKTLACNLESLSQFGYFKDFPEILYRILQGSEIRKIQKSERFKRKTEASRGRRAPFNPNRSGVSYGGRGGRGRGSGRRGGKRKPVATRELRVANAERKNQADKARASLDRKKKKVSMGKDAFTRYSHDPDYRYLHERVSDLFANQLKRDLEFLTSDQTNKISLAAKWCPSLDSSFDKATLLCESIARKIFPRESFPEYEGVDEAHYAYRVRDRLRKEVLVPLRKTLQLPEVYMGARNWDTLPYNRVASVAMKTYKDIFLNHDAERFQQYLDDAKTGKTKVAAGAVLPHEIIRDLDGGDGGQVAELQWKRTVDDLKEKGSLRNCIAICDVSGSMDGDPMEVSVALGLLVSELSEEPWRGKLITFSQNPEMHLVTGDDLRSKSEFVRNMQWGMNTDFQKVFDLILRVAVEGNLKPEEMIKRVFVFSDMEFDQASSSSSSNAYGRQSRSNEWETDYEVIVRKYRQNGYGEVVPDIVFWNLRDSRATPVPGNKKGVALVSGFSKNLMKMFLEHDGEINPMMMMEAAISKQVACCD